MFKIWNHSSQLQVHGIHFFLKSSIASEYPNDYVQNFVTAVRNKSKAGWNWNNEVPNNNLFTEYVSKCV